jgi:hypothetical protein
MPNPIQSTSNSSVYDPAACDPAIMSCQEFPPRSEVATIEPVTIEGDAGKQALLKQYDANQCWSKKGDAALACGTVVVSAVGTAVTSPTGVGLVAGAALTTMAAANCVRLIADYDDCVDESRSKREAAAACEANQGVPLLSASGDQIVCLVER